MRIKRSGVISVILVTLLAAMLALPLPALAQPVINTYTGTVTINGGTLASGPNVRVNIPGWDDPIEVTEAGGQYGITAVGTLGDVGKDLSNAFEVNIDGMGWAPADAVCVDCEGATPKFVGTAEAQHINLTYPSGGPVVPAVAFGAANYDVTEGSGKMINVVLSGTTTNTVTVGYSTASIGDALPGVDYNTTSGTLTFNPGDLTKSFQVTTINDTDYEPVDEVFHVQLANANNANLGTPNPATVTIQDDGDPPPPQPDVYFDIPVIGYFQGNEGATAVIEVVLSEASDETVTVDYATQQRTGAGAATGGGVDYNNANGTLTFLPGDTSETFQVTLIDDGQFEGTEKFDVVLSNANGATRVPPSTAEVRINNINPSEVQWWCQAERVALIAPYPDNNREELVTPVDVARIQYGDEDDWFQIFYYDEMGADPDCQWLTYVGAEGFVNDGDCTLTQLVPGEYYYVVVSDKTKPLEW